jgi:hypothetical protein
MPQTFKSAACSKGIWIPFYLILGAVSISIASLDNLFIGLGIFALFSAYFLDICLRTSYTIDRQNLHIRSGVFYKKTIDIQSIRKVSEGGAAYKGPAPSLDRLELVYKRQRLVISPADKKRLQKPYWH